MIKDYETHIWPPNQRDVVFARLAELTDDKRTEIDEDVAFANEYLAARTLTESISYHDLDTPQLVAALQAKPLATSPSLARFLTWTLMLLGALAIAGAIALGIYLVVTDQSISADLRPATTTSPTSPG